MSDIDLLESVLAKDTALLEGVRADSMSAATPCPDYDVKALVDHIVASASVFAAGANERPSDTDFATFEATEPVKEFRAAAEEMVAGWRAHGTERTVSLMGSGMPGAAILGMTVMEFVTHGWDLAVATGQAVPFTDEELATTLERAHANLPEQYRGAGKPFGDIVDVPADAPVLDRLVAFMGRRTP